MLHIVSAHFGHVDVTLRLRGLVRNGTLYIPKGANIINLLGDPVPNHRKRLYIDYTLNNISLWHEGRERDGLLCHTILLGQPAIAMLGAGRPNREQLYIALLGKEWNTYYHTNSSIYQLYAIDHVEDMSEMIELVRKTSTILDVAVVRNKTIILSRRLPQPSIKKRVLILCAYHQTPERQLNLEFFQRHGMRDVNDDFIVDYLLIINGRDCAVQLLDKWHSVIRRSNSGYDFAGWDTGIQIAIGEKYDYVAGLNFSIRGPFASNWIARYVELLTDSIKLAGITVSTNNETYLITHDVNLYRRPCLAHVQSMLWFTDSIGLDIIKSVLAQRHVYFGNVIINQEVGMSQAILNAGYNITSILPRLQGEFRRDIMIHEQPFCLDPWGEGHYFGGTIDPREAIFFKTNRFVNYLPIEQATREQDESVENLRQ